MAREKRTHTHSRLKQIVVPGAPLWAVHADVTDESIGSIESTRVPLLGLIEYSEYRGLGYPAACTLLSHGRAEDEPLAVYESVIPLLPYVDGAEFGCFGDGSTSTNFLGLDDQEPELKSWETALADYAQAQKRQGRKTAGVEASGPASR